LNQGLLCVTIPAIVFPPPKFLGTEIVLADIGEGLSAPNLFTISIASLTGLFIVSSINFTDDEEIGVV
jgi:hypothetical protein